MATNTTLAPADRTTARVVLESATAVAPHLPVALAGSVPGALHEALAAANDRGRAGAEAQLSRWLPSTPHDDRRRTEVAPTVGQIGAELLANLSGDRILDALDGLDGRSGRITLHRRGPGGAERLDVQTVLRDPGSSTGPAVLDIARLASRLNEDLTLGLNNLDTMIPELACLAEAVERATGTCVRVDAFVSGSGAVGLGRHSDPLEMWVLQLEGSKQWTLWKPSIEWFVHERVAPGFFPLEEELSIVLSSGQSLVVPRGHLHRVEPRETLTIALNIVLHAPSRVELLESYLLGVGGQAEWLEPVHAAHSRPTASVGPAHLDGLEAELRGELARFRANIRPRGVGSSASAIRAGVAGSVAGVAFRSALGGGVHVVQDVSGGDDVVFAGGGKVVRLVRHCIPMLELVFSGSPFTIEELADRGPADLATGLVVDLRTAGLLTAIPPDLVASAP